MRRKKPTRRPSPAPEPDPGQPVVHYREIEVERLVLREPRDGRVRAILDTGPDRGPDPTRTAAVRLTLFAPDGLVALVAEVGADGEATLFIGNPDAGPGITITQTAIDLWSGGNVAARLTTNEDNSGRVEIMGADGRTVLELPPSRRA